MIKWETQNVNVVDLLLDDENIRLDDGRTDASQDALIHDLFINQNAFELVLSITRNGLFPHEIPITLRSGKRLTVIEGNRRIAALKAIIQPSLVPSHAGKIEKAKKDNLFVPIETLDVKVAPSRDAVQPLLAAIHTTESRKPWATLRQAYFYYAQIESTGRTISELIDEYPHVDVPRFVRMWEMHLIARSILYDSNEDAIKVADQQKFPITTLERIYNNESFRSKFGIVFDQHGRVTINAEPEGFKKAYKHLIEDILNNVVTSRSHNKTAEINRYVAQLPAAKMTDDITSTASPEFGPVAPKPKLRTPKGLAPKRYHM
ncbi:hypothetical protein QPK87_06535 [Kamptonema cortianum]|nr:hypothetical protein [Kamptonema cortianum]